MNSTRPVAAAVLQCHDTIAAMTLQRAGGTVATRHCNVMHCSTSRPLGLAEAKKTRL
jgi:hypothetical protein